MRAIIDSDVLIDYLLGVEAAAVELDFYTRREISIVSWMEVMAGARTEAQQAAARAFLDTFMVHALTAEVAEVAVKLRRTFRLRLPDAVIWATARVENGLLVTRNTRDFPSDEPGLRFPYATGAGK